MKLSRISTGGDNKFAGEEPTWSNQSEIENLKTAEMSALTWYNYFCDRKQSKTFLLEYVKGVGRPKPEVDAVSKTSENSFPIQVGWIARMMSQGYQPSERFKEFFQTEYKRIIENAKKNIPVVEEEPSTPVVNIQDRIREKASEEAGEIEGIVDDFIHSGCKSNIDMNSYFRSRKLSSVVLKRICEVFITQSKYIEEVMTTKDEQLKEGYSNFTKPELRRFKDFLDSIVVAANSRASVKPTRKKRKVKEKPATVLVAKMNYAKDFAELGLVSVAPEKVIGALQVWTYNTKTKLLGVYNADNAKGLSVKGSTLQNFNEQTSIGKRLRKPAATIKELMEAGKVKIKKILPDLSTKESNLTGRMNSDTIILRIVN